MNDATIVDVEGRWILHWPDGQRTVPAARELLVQITDDHNAQKAEIDRLQAELDEANDINACLRRDLAARNEP